MLKAWGLATLIAWGCAVLFLWSPLRPAATPYFTYKPLRFGAGYYDHFESAHYCHLAEQPSQLLNFYEARQSRPVYILLGTVLGYPIKFFFNPSGHRHTPFFYGYILLNFVLLGASAGLMLWALNRTDYFSAMVVGLTIGSSELVKTFVFIPSPQLFNWLAPALILALALRYKNSGFFGLVGLGLGVGFLTYGTFAIAVPVLLWLARQNKWRWYGAWGLLLGFIFPVLVWVSWVKLKAGYFYSSEKDDYRQFIWIWDKLNLGVIPFLEGLFMYGIAFIQSLVTALWVYMVLLLGVLLKSWDTLSIKPVILVQGGVTLIFLYSLGFYPERLMTNLLPVWVALVLSLSFTHGKCNSSCLVVLVGLILLFIYNVTG